MQKLSARLAKTTLIVLFAGAALASAETETPIADALSNVSPEVIKFNDHLTTLASPFMEGRVPGSRGMEIARQYMEFWLEGAGLEPAFPATTIAEDGSEIITPRASYRQPFPLGGRSSVTAQKLAVRGADAFEPETEYTVTAMGKPGEVTAPVVFVGYSIDNGRNDYSSYDETDDLSGKIALMLRFEPMDEEGSSLWSDSGWSGRASFRNKLRSVSERNPAGVIIVNTPGADDPRVGQLMGVGSGGSSDIDVPVLMMTAEAAEKIVAASTDGRSLMDLRKLADEGRAVVPLDTKLTMQAEIETESLNAENVAGLLPGRGRLADEYIIVGAHLDHLGMGYFGSRSGPGELHPGADDNASGAAGVLIFADKLARSYAEAPEGTDLRSVVFVGFDAEESGLNGSRYYVNNPIVPIDDHKLMINFDMIGRITNDRLSVSGAETGAGMADWLDPFFEESPLEIVQGGRSGGGSDHASFLRQDVPILFGIIADFHGDYHTPADTSDKINRVGAVQTIDLFHDIALAMAQRYEPFEFQDGDANAGQAAPRGDIKVRFGIMPGNYNDTDPGVAIGAVTPGGSAEIAGVEEGDRLIRWDGQKIEGMMPWMEMLGSHKPGDEIKIGVLRDGKEVTLDVKLQAK